MLHLVTWIPRIPHNNNPILRNADLRCCFPGILNIRHLRHNCLCAGVFELEGQFIDGVAWVGWGENTPGPVAAPCYGGRVDAVWCVEGEDVAFLPVPEGFQAGAEGDCGGFYLGVGVGAGGVGVEVDYCLR